MLICFITVPITTIIPLIVIGHINALKKALKALKIILLLFFMAEYFRIFIIYFVPIWFKDLKVSKVLFLWNIGLSFVACASALASLVAYLIGELDFITFLWQQSNSTQLALI
jgi:hypothetical protein